MTTPRRVQKHRQADAARRKVRTVGKRVRTPQQRRPTARAPRYQKSAATFGLSGVLSMLAFATGSIFWAIGAVTTAGAGAAVARLEYRRDLATVRRTGKPIGAKPSPATAARRTDDLEEIVEPEPVDLDQPPRPRAAPQQTRRPTTRPGQHGPPGHEAVCKAKRPENCPYWRAANKGRTTTTKRASGARRKTT